MLGKRLVLFIYIYYSDGSLHIDSYVVRHVYGKYPRV